jgi:formyltetrahydrofolate deformylase
MTTLPTEKNTFIITATCRAGTGVVAAVTGFLAERDCYICALEQFDDESTDKFFLRAVFHLQQGSPDIDAIRETFVQVGAKFDMTYNFYDPAQPVKTAILVSKYDHCLNDLLYRKRNGDLNLEITAVVSNHLDLMPMTEREGIRFIHLPVSKDNKPEQEQRLLAIIQDNKTELVVLARYMQILSNHLTTELTGKCINIHHSFLPGFRYRTNKRPVESRFPH